MKGLRLLHLPNESTLGNQVGPRKAFGRLEQEGLLAAYETFSYLIEDRNSQNHDATLGKLEELVTSFEPDVIFWQHPTDRFSVQRPFLAKLKTLASRPRLVLHDGDPYGRLFKRIPRSMRALLAESDLVFLVGLGYLADLARACGASRIFFAPHSYDNKRFGEVWEQTVERTHDAVMIGNLPRMRRLPWLYLPGGLNRKRLADSMYEEFGDRFVVFGSMEDWHGKPYCHGPIPFEEQHSIIRSSWLSVNWGIFDKISFYCSNRLPISLAAGVPHITNYQPSYEHIYHGIPGLYVIKSAKEAVDVARYLISQPRRRLISLGTKASHFAAEHLEADRRYRDIVQVIGEQLFSWPPELETSADSTPS